MAFMRQLEQQDVAIAARDAQASEEAALRAAIYDKHEELREAVQAQAASHRGKAIQASLALTLTPTLTRTAAGLA